MEGRSPLLCWLGIICWHESTRKLKPVRGSACRVSSETSHTLPCQLLWRTCKEFRFMIKIALAKDHRLEDCWSFSLD
jgi:hypothetical protein